MRKFIIGVVAAMVAAASCIVSAAPANAAGVNNVTITYRKVASSSPSYLIVCKDWGTTSCKSTSLTAWLYNGENSKKKLGWTDTDGIRVGAGCTATIKGSAGMKDSYFGGTSGKWVKVSGQFQAIWGSNYTVNVTC